MLNIRILNDSANGFYCQRIEPRSTAWWEMLAVLVMTGILFSLVARLYRRSRLVSLMAGAIVFGLATWFSVGILSAGQLVQEFEINRAADTLLVQAFYKGNDRYMGKPRTVPLDQVLRADIESGKYGNRFVLTLRDQSVIYPLGYASSYESNDFFVLEEIRRHLVPAQDR